MGYSRKGVAISLLILLAMLMPILPSIIVINPAPLPEQNAPARTFAGPSANNTVTLHLHWDNVTLDRRDRLNTSSPYDPSNFDYDGDPSGNYGITIQKTASGGSYNVYNFSLFPSVNAPLNMSGNVVFNFWTYISTSPQATPLNCSLIDVSSGGGTLINGVSVSPTIQASPATQQITIPLKNYVLQTGHSLVLRLFRENSGPAYDMFVYYDKSIYDSTVSCHFISHFNISDSGIYGIDTLPRTEFGSQETIWAFANVTDALGAYDIKNASLIVKNLTTSSTVVSKNMPISSSGPSLNPAWKLFESSFGPLPAGNYSVNITTADNSGNLFWTEWTIKIIEIDHFNIVASTSEAEAGSAFTLTIEAMDAGNNRMKNWSGNIVIEAIDDETGLPIAGLSNTSILMSSSNQGLIMIIENFTVAPKNITIRATNGTTVGESQLISISPGAICDLSVDPINVIIPAGDTTQLTAYATDSFGNPNASWQPYWYLDHPANGTLVQNGMSVQLTAILTGQMYLICKDNSTGKNFTVEVNVTASNLVSIVVTPGTVDVAAGATQSFTALGYDQYNNVITGVSFVWSTSIGTMTGSTLTAQTTSGTGYVRATYSSVSGDATVTVVPGALDHIDIAPSSLNLAAGSQSQFTATGKDAFNNVISGLTFTWDTTVGSITSSGLLTAQTTAGASGYVNASVGAKTGTASVTIISGQLAQIVVAPSTVDVIAGATQAFTAIGYDEYSNVLTGLVFTWTTDVGMMAGSTLTAQTAAGSSGYVRAISGLVSNDASVTIVPGALDHIDMSPATLVTGANSQHQFAATGKDAFNNTISSLTFTWTTTVGTVTSAGLFTSQTTAGVHGYVNASVGAKTGAANVTIISGQLTRIVVTPISDIIWEDSNTSIIAIGYDDYGNPLGIAGAVWSSEGFAMAMVVGSGSSGTLFAGMAPETGTVKVTLGAISGNASISVICPPQGPTLGTFPNQVGYEDVSWAVDLSVYWNDPNGLTGLTWFVIGVNDSLLIISHDMVSASTINFIPQPNANGINLVTFWVRDPTGYTNLKQISITVLPVNDAPSFINDPPTELYVKFALPYSFNYSYYVEDVDNPRSQLLLTADPSDDISSSGLTLSYDFPDENSAEPYFRIVTVTISDGSLYDSLTLKIWATSDTPPDLVNPLPDVTIMEGQMGAAVFDLDDYFADVDGDLLFYSEGFENVVIQINSTSHEVFVSSPTEWSGQTTAVFVAHDPTGAIRIDTIVITVIAVNDPPAISYIPPVFVHHSVDYLLDLRLYVSDPDNDLSVLTIYTDNPVSASYSNIPYPHLKLNYPANLGGGAYAGPYEVVVLLHVADSGGLFAEVSFTVKVSDDYPPVFTRSPPEIISFTEDTYLDKPYSLDLKLLFSDPDSGDELSFAFSGNVNVSVMIGTDGWLNFSAAPNWYGTEYITFNATDSHGAWLSFRVRVDVIPVNDPPVLSQIEDIDHYGGRQWSMDISDYITDVDDPDLLLIEIIVDQPSFVRAVGTTLYFEFPDDVDSVMVILYVTDGQSNSNMITFNVNIKQTITEIIPWQTIAILLAIGILCYLIALRILPHKLQELFLIHNDGRLISHSGKEGEKAMDQDVVSAMFTAVQEFIRDSFKEGGESLKKLDMGDRKIVIEKGKWIYAALIYTGWPPKSVFKNLTHFIKDIEEAYGSGIEHWDGTLRSLPGIEEVSQGMLIKKYHAGDANQIRDKKMSGARFEDLAAEKPDDSRQK